MPEFPQSAILGKGISLSTKAPVEQPEEDGIFSGVWDVIKNAAGEVYDWGSGMADQYGRMRAAEVADLADSMPNVYGQGTADAVRKPFADNPLGSYETERGKAYNKAAPVMMGVGLIPTPATRLVGMAALPYMADEAKKVYDEKGGGLYGAASTAKAFTIDPAVDLAQQIYDSPESRAALWEQFTKKPIETTAGIGMAGLGLFGLGKGIKVGAKGLAYAKEQPQQLNPLHRYEVNKNASQIESDYYAKKKGIRDKEATDQREQRIDDLIRRISQDNYYGKKAEANAQAAETANLQDLLDRLTAKQDYGAFDRGEVAEVPSYGAPQSADRFVNIANSVSEQTGIPAEFIYGQMARETGWFKHDRAHANNNFAGLWGGADGKKYANDVEFANDYAKILNQDNFAEARQAKTPEEFAAALSRGGYFEDSNVAGYGQTIREAIDEYRAKGGRTGGTSGGEIYQEGLPTYGEKYYTISDQVSDSGLTELTEQKLNALAKDFRERFGEDLYITSMKRHGDGSSWHDSGQAIDIAGGILETSEEARAWLMERGKQYGLVGLDEYANPSPHATGGHIHFSDHGDVPQGIRKSGGAGRQTSQPSPNTPAYSNTADTSRVGEVQTLSREQANDAEYDSYNEWLKQYRTQAQQEDKIRNKLGEYIDRVNTPLLPERGTMYMPESVYNDRVNAFAEQHTSNIYDRVNTPLLPTSRIRLPESVYDDRLQKENQDFRNAQNARSVRDIIDQQLTTPSGRVSLQPNDPIIALQNEQQRLRQQRADERAEQDRRALERMQAANERQAERQRFQDQYDAADKQRQQARQRAQEQADARRAEQARAKAEQQEQRGLLQRLTSAMGRAKDSAQTVEGVERELANLTKQRDDIINSSVEQARKDYKGKGTTSTLTYENYETDGIFEGKGDGKVTGRVTVSNNEPWYRAFYDKYKRAPREKDFDSGLMHGFFEDYLENGRGAKYAEHGAMDTAEMLDSLNTDIAHRQKIIEYLQKNPAASMADARRAAAQYERKWENAEERYERERQERNDAELEAGLKADDEYREWLGEEPAELSEGLVTRRQALQRQYEQNKLDRSIHNERTLNEYNKARRERIADENREMHDMRDEEIIEQERKTKPVTEAEAHKLEEDTLQNILHSVNQKYYEQVYGRTPLVEIGKIKGEKRQQYDEKLRGDEKGEQWKAEQAEGRKGQRLLPERTITRDDIKLLPEKTKAGQSFEEQPLDEWQERRLRRGDLEKEYLESAEQIKPKADTVEDVVQKTIARVEGGELPKRRRGRPTKAEQAERARLEVERKQKEVEEQNERLQNMTPQERKQAIEDEIDQLDTDIYAEAAQIVNAKLKASGATDEQIANLRGKKDRDMYEKKSYLYDEMLNQQVDEMLTNPKNYGGAKHRGRITEKLERYNELANEHAKIVKGEVEETRANRKSVGEQVRQSKARQTAKTKAQKPGGTMETVDRLERMAKGAKPKDKKVSELTEAKIREIDRGGNAIRDLLHRRIMQEYAIGKELIEQGKSPEWEDWLAERAEKGEIDGNENIYSIIDNWLKDTDPKYKGLVKLHNAQSYSSRDGILYNLEGGTGASIGESGTGRKVELGRREGTGEYKGETVTQNQIWQAANELFGIAREGSMPNKKTLGYFDSNRNVVRIGEWAGKAHGMKSEWSVLFHEIGHRVDKALGGLEKQFSTQAKAELGKFMQELYGDKLHESYRPDQIFEEGFANFLAEYVCDPESALRHKAACEEFGKILARDTDLAARVYEMQDMLKVNREQPDAAKIAGTITSRAEDVPATWKEKAKKAWERVLEEVENKRRGLHNVDKDRAKKLGRELTEEESIEVAASQEKSKGVALARVLLEGRDGKSILETLKAERPDADFKEASLKMAVDKIVELRDKHGDWLKQNKVDAQQAVNSYLLAKHFDEVYREKYEKPLAAMEERLADLWDDMNQAKIAGKEKINAAREAWKEAEADIADSYDFGKGEVRRAVREAQRAREEYRKTKAKVEKDIEAKENAANKLKELLDAKKKRGYKLPGNNSIETYRRFLKSDVPKELKEAAQLLWDTNDNLLTLMVHDGLISKETAARLRKDYPHYCSLARDFPNDAAKADEAIIQAFGGTSGFKNVGKPLERLSEDGSTYNVQNPLENYEKNIIKITSMIERNNVGRKLVDAAEELGMPEIAHEVPGSANTKHSSFYIFKDGKKVVYETTPEIYRALGDYTPQGMYKVIDTALRIPARWLRAGATTANFSFGVVNYLRDNLTAWTMSGGEYRPFADAQFMEALKGIAYDKYGWGKGSKLWNEYKASGAQMATEIRAFEDFKTNVLDPLQKSSRRLKVEKTLSIIEHLENVNDVWEQATRLGLYKRRLDKGGSRISAAHSARSNTLDFGRGGRAVMVANRYIPFLNAGIQGTSLLVRRLANPKTRGKVMMQGALITVASAAIHSVIRSDDDYSAAYDEAPEYVKDMYWLIPCGKDKNGKPSWWRIPKPFGEGMLFASLPTRMIDYSFGYDKDALKEWGGRMLHDSLTQYANPVELITNVQAAKPIWELTANYDSFRKRDIVPDYMRNLKPEDQYDKGTSEFAKGLGRLIGVSPKKIDHAGRGFFSGLYGMPNDVIDAATTDKPYQDPITKRLTFDADASPRSMQRYYDRRKELQQAHASQNKTGRRMDAKDLRDYRVLQSYEKYLKKINQGIQAAEKAGNEKMAEQWRGYRRKLIKQADKQFNKNG